MSYQQSWPAYPPAGPGYGPPIPVRRSAPASIHLVAILQYLGGLLFLAAAAALALAAANVSENPMYADFDLATGRDAKVVLGVLAGGLAFVGLVVIFIGRRLQRGRNWARILLIVLNVLSIVGTLYQSFGVLGDARYAGGVVVPVLYLILLNTRAARSWCRYHTY